MIDKNTALSTELNHLPAYLSSFSEVVPEGLEVQTYTQPNKLSINGKQFNIHKGEGEIIEAGSSIKVIVLNANPATGKVFFETTYDGSEGVAPRCTSKDGVKPDSYVKDPINPSGCLMCPNNAAGSGKDGKSKACADYKLVSVLSELDPEPLLLTLKITGLISLKEYLRDLKLKHKIGNPSAVVTEMYFQAKDPKTNKAYPYPRIGFRPLSYISEDVVERVMELQQSEEVLYMLKLVPEAVVESKDEVFELPPAKSNSFATGPAKEATVAPAPVPVPVTVAKPKVEAPKLRTSIAMEDKPTVTERELAVASEAIEKALAEELARSNGFAF
jgi:hypothetical protein